MSTASVTYSFTNATTADATQVNTNFTDLVSFINGSLPHSDGSGGAADIRGLVVVGATGWKVKAGKTAYTMTAQSGIDVTVTYGTTFATVVALLLTVKSDSNIPLISYMNGAPGLSSAGTRVETKGGGNTTQSGDLHWIVIGT